MSILIPLMALAISFGFVFLWYKTSPGTGSGWAMFATVLIAFGALGALDGGSTYIGQEAQLMFALVAASGFGFVWYHTRHKEDSGWLLAVAILSTLAVL